MSHSIQAIKFKTSNPEKFAVLVGSTEEKVDQSQFNKGMIICLDSSGSMSTVFTDPDLSEPAPSINVLVPPSSAAPQQSLVFPASSMFASSASPMAPLSVDVGPFSSNSFNFPPMAPGPMSQYPDDDTPAGFDFSQTQSQHLFTTPGFSLATLNQDQYQDDSSNQTPLPMSGNTGFGASSLTSSFDSVSYINKNTRLGCVDSFMSKIFDLFDFVERTQGINVPLTVIVFGSHVKVISNIDEKMSYQMMKLKTSKALTQGGGTNYELAINETNKYKPKYDGEVTTIFLSDGGHSDGRLTKEKLIQTYPKFFNYCIGLGEGNRDYDDSTLKALGEEFIRGTNPQRIRDFVAGIALGIATMRAKNIHVSSSNPTDILVSNMEKKEDGYRHKEMSILMELYFSITNTANMKIKYEKSDGTQMEINVDDSTPVMEDTEFGDKVLQTMEILETISKVSETTKDMTTVEKLTYLSDFKKSITSNPITKTCIGTRIHNYYLTVMNSVEKMMLTKDERRLKDLTKNVRSDVYNAVSSAGADYLCSPGVSMGPLSSYNSPASFMTPSSAPCNKNRITNVKCNICCTNDREIVFIPCGHFLSCSTCTLNPKVLDDGCPYCRSKIEGCILVSLDDSQKVDDWDMVCTSCNREHVICISKDCSHIFSCVNCIERQKRDIKRVKARMNWLTIEIQTYKSQGKNTNLLEDEMRKLEEKGKKNVECSICHTKCTKYVQVHI